MTIAKAIAARLNDRRIQRPGQPPIGWCGLRKRFIDTNGKPCDLSLDDLLSEEWEVV